MSSVILHTVHFQYEKTYFSPPRLSNFKVVNFAKEVKRWWMPSSVIWLQSENGQNLVKQRFGWTHKLDNTYLASQRASYAKNFDQCICQIAHMAPVLKGQEVFGALFVLLIGIVWQVSLDLWAMFKESGALVQLQMSWSQTIQKRIKCWWFRENVSVIWPVLDVTVCSILGVMYIPKYVGISSNLFRYSTFKFIVQMNEILYR